jgi:hypothetical protein
MYCDPSLGHIKPLLTQTMDTLALAGESEVGNTFLASALIQSMEKLPCAKLDIPALFSNSAITPEEAVATLIHRARWTQPEVPNILHLTTLLDWCTETVWVWVTMSTLAPGWPPVYSSPPGLSCVHLSLLLPGTWVLGHVQPAVQGEANRESKFFMFFLSVNTEEVDDYLQYVKEVMDIKRMHMKLDDGV